MASIQVLDQATVNQIAAGEVIERPSSVVKECVENALDAGANAVTVEIRDGGISLIRITDNGAGIGRDDVRAAFLPHATSKIRTAEDLMNISSLGFRGEALASIAAVSQVELITKTKDSLTGIRYRIEGGEEKEFSEIGAPDGTTFIARELFFNTPARRKFLKTGTTEGAYISALMERLALSRPDVSFRLISNNQTKLHTSGNDRLKDVIYTIYGREISSCLLTLDRQAGPVRITGFAGKPEINRGNRSFENYFINGRYVKSALITKAIENAYRGYVMQQKYPFVTFHMEIPSDLLDVNVHPTKMELRFSNEEEVYEAVTSCIRDALGGKELIPRHAFDEKQPAADRGAEAARGAEPFEERRRGQNGPFPVRSDLREASDREASPVRSDLREASDREASPVRSDLREVSDREPFSARQPFHHEPSTFERFLNNQKNAAVGNALFHDRQNAGAGADTVAQRETAVHTGRDEYEKAPEAAKADALVTAMSDGLTPPGAGGLTPAGSGGLTPPGLGALTPAGSGAVTPPEADALALAFETPCRTAEGPVLSESRAVYGAGAGDAGEASAAPNSVSARQDESPESGSSGGEVRQMELFDDRLLTADTRSQYRIIGQLFDTFWLFQYRDQLLIMDQHAAHEKVLYERNVRAFREKEFTSQQLQPPIILTLNAREAQVVTEQEELFARYGFQIEPFGGREYAVYAVPGNLLGLAEEDLLKELIDTLADESGHTESSMIDDKLALMSCKAAVKGNNRLSVAEVEALLDEMLKLENPYMCPHGRPTIITFSHTELDRKFKRIVN